MLKAFLIGGVVAIVAFLAIGLLAKPIPQGSVADRIAGECARQFGGQGSEAVDRCRLALMAKYLTDRQAEKLNSAYDKVR